MAIIRTSLALAVLGSSLGAIAVQKSFAQADTGWTPVFNGKNLDGLYIRSGQAILRDPATQNYARVESDGSLYIANPGPAGAICTKADLSYYHARIQYHFPSDAGTPNAGILYHVDSLDYLPGYAIGSNTVDIVPSLQPSCGGSWFPKGWEAQMRRGQSGAIYGVANVWGETTAKDGKWDPAGAPRTITPSYNSGPKSLNPSQGTWPDGPSGWVTMEVLVYGADSVIHVVNGTRVFKMTRLRHNRLMVPCGKDGGLWATGEQLPLTNGKHCVQIEGTSITYRKWEMRPLPKSGGSTAVREGRNRDITGTGLRVRQAPGRRQAGFECSAPPSAGPLLLEVRSPEGRLVRAFRLEAGSRSLAWDLTDVSGHPAGRGLYLVRLASDRSHAPNRTLAAQTLLID